jgi:hypothetical protein
MNPRSSLSSAALALAVAFTGCSNQVALNPQDLAVNIITRPVSIPVGTTMIFSSIISVNAAVPQWSLLYAADASDPGSLTAVTTPAHSISYTAPATPPIYSGALPSGFTQGTVTIVVTADAPPGTSYPTARNSVTFFITAPSITVGIAPKTATMALGSFMQFAGYAVGSVNNAITWQVNGVPGGSVAVGTITSAGIYTAPANLPMSGNTVTITAISQADLNKSASAVVTLQ